MSHKVTGSTEIKNREILDNALGALGLQALPGDTHKLYSSQTTKGVGVKLPGWSYPAVFNLETGEVSYDNYGGSWGKIEELNKLKQQYGVSKAVLTARRLGKKATVTSVGGKKRVVVEY